MTEETFSPDFEGSDEVEGGLTKSPYNIFCDLCVNALKIRNPGLQMTVNQMNGFLKQCADCWKELPETKKKNFKILAQREEEKYEREMGILTSAKNSVEVSQEENEEKTLNPSEPVQNVELNSDPTEMAKSRRSTRNTLKMTKKTIGKGQARGSKKKTDGHIKKRTRCYSKANGYSRDESQEILDYACDVFKIGYNSLFKIGVKAKEDGKFPNRTVVAIQQQLSKIILPNLDNYVCSAENRELLLSVTRNRSRGPSAKKRNVQSGGDE